MNFQAGLLKKCVTEDFIIVWTNNNYVHQWIKNEYKRRKNEDPPKKFKLRLKRKHILKLRNDIINEQLYHDTGYYWGSDYDYYNEHHQRDIKFLKLALTYCRCGNKIYYVVI